MKKKPAYFYLISSILIILFILFTIYVSKYIIEFFGNPDEFRAWVDNHGILGPIVYIFFSFFQILLCFIPGEPLELVAGYAFGRFYGTLYCFIGEAIGSILVILLTKKYGRKLVELFFEKEKIESLKFLKSSPSRIAIFTTIFILPGTPKDLFCYIAGLTDIKLSFLVLITTLGRIPSIITSTIGADALGEKNYTFAIITFIITIFISLLGIYIYNRLTKKMNQSSSDIQDK